MMLYAILFIVRLISNFFKSFQNDFPVNIINCQQRLRKALAQKALPRLPTTYVVYKK